ncbi:DUF1499 domain-containing protein [Aurantiacibacter poecillastricola]|uniref:DUF1499 domain-containing protein n=1 Tax=Aurantiacibacter poecillastricola TaxID=3064385 RepID=UPI00273E67CB|nr:DUF1499 domain-containing protein [Aurantiacibacter sp. 219JJ12-13]MDP5261484.1 DUF1499 domain-containing protein [Aurantiacibacter sp. 219JJ12-13]
MADTHDTVTPAANRHGKAAKAVRWTGIFVLGGAIIAIAVVLVAATLARYGVIDKLAGFAPFYMALNPARALTVIGIIGLVFAFYRRSGEVPRLFVGTLLAGGLTLAIYLLLVIPGGKAPPIHDVTTDLNDPPQFSTLDVDEVSTGPITQEEWRAYHEEAYGDIEPVIIDKPPQEVLANARALAEARGWDIASADPEAGVLEATAYAGYIRFMDDVVVEVTPVADGSTRVDMRSVSRVGVSDLGYNAARVREFLADLRVAE